MTTASSSGLKPEAGGGRTRVNLSRASILLLDDTLGLEILNQIFYGFGARTLYRSRTATEAQEVIAVTSLDLIVTEAAFDGQDGYGLVRAVRAGAYGDTNRFTPIIVLSAHTDSSKVASARDCGANFFVAKPISPQIIMDRLLWVSREKRQYLEADHYVGPDRRFHDAKTPEGVAGRRRTDAPAAPPAAAPEPPCP